MTLEEVDRVAEKLYTDFFRGRDWQEGEDEKFDLLNLEVSSLTVHEVQIGMRRDKSGEDTLTVDIIKESDNFILNNLPQMSTNCL